MAVALADTSLMTAMQMQQLAYFRLDRARQDDSDGIEITVYPEVPGRPTEPAEPARTDEL